MPWPMTAALFGALGGLLVSLIDFGTDLADWRTARKRTLAHARNNARHRRARLPRFRMYSDPVADAWAAVWRLLLGAGGAAVFSGQITGIVAAIAVGASAPALLRQLGNARTIQDALIQPADENPDAPDPGKEVGQ